MEMSEESAIPSDLFDDLEELEEMEEASSADHLQPQENEASAAAAAVTKEHQNQIQALDMAVQIVQQHGQLVEKAVAVQKGKETDQTETALMMTEGHGQQTEVSATEQQAPLQGQAAQHESQQQVRHDKRKKLI